jgi:hypothetical protein
MNTPKRGSRGPRKGFGGRPRKGTEHRTLRTTRPWEKIGISQRTWYRHHRAEKEAKAKKRMSDDDYKQKIRDGMGDLLAQVAAGEISAEEAEQELDVCKALAELIVIPDYGPFSKRGD